MRTKIATEIKQKVIKVFPYAAAVSTVAEIKFSPCMDVILTNAHILLRKLPRFG